MWVITGCVIMAAIRGTQHTMVSGGPEKSLEKDGGKQCPKHAKRSPKDRKGPFGLNDIGNIDDVGKSRFNGLVMGIMEEEDKEIDGVRISSPRLAVKGSRR